MVELLDKDLITIPIPIARGGINKDIEPTSLQGVYTPFMLNMILEPNRVRKRLGYRQIGTNLPLSGTGAKLIEYVDARGNIHTIAITTTHAYEYQPSSDLWLQITPSIYLENCESGWTGGTSVTLAHDDEHIRSSKSAKLTLTAARADGDQLAYKDISSVDISAMTHIGFWIKSSAALAANALEIVISESNHASGEKTGTYVECLTTALTADTWTFVCLAKTLTSYDAVISCSIYANATLADELVIYLDDIRGYDEFGGAVGNPISASLATDVNEFTGNGGLAQIISNGIDDLFYYEGDTDDVFTTLAHAYPSFANCVAINEFWNHFMLINFNEGDQNVRSVAWADVGDIDDFSAGTSGLSYLTDSIGKIIAASKLGADLILYSTRSITTCRYHGTSIVFLFPTLIYRTGLYAANAIVELTNRHQFLGTDQRVYEYIGGSQLALIGRNIETSLFAELDNSKRAHIVCGYDEAKDRSYFAFPRVSDTYAQAAYCMNRKQPELPWEYFEFADDIRSIIMHENQVAWYCDDAQFSGIYCDKASFYCDVSSAEADYPIMITLSSDGYVYAHDETLGKDDDADIECEYQTQDITVDKEEHFARWEWLTFVVKSVMANGTVSIFYSIDEGDTWTEFDDSPVTLTSNWAANRLPFDVIGRKIRFRFHQDSSSDLQIRDDMHVSFVLETTRS